jgi:hypothetical protein
VAYQPSESEQSQPFASLRIDFDDLEAILSSFVQISRSGGRTEDDNQGGAAQAARVYQEEAATMMEAVVEEEEGQLPSLGAVVVEYPT